MAGTGLATVHSTRLLLPLSPRFEKDHELEPGDTPTANRYTVLDGGSPGYFLFIYRSLIVTYFSFAL